MARPSSALLLLALLPAVAAAQPKRPAPKVVEEERDGKTVRVMLLAPGDSVTVGDVRYEFGGLIHTPEKRMTLTFRAANGHKTRAVHLNDVVVISDDLRVTDDTDRVYKAVRTNLPGGEDVDPGHKAACSIMYPAPYKTANVKMVTVEMKARGDGADLWRVVYPRNGWKSGKD